MSVQEQLQRLGDMEVSCRSVCAGGHSSSCGVRVDLKRPILAFWEEVLYSVEYMGPNITRVLGLEVNVINADQLRPSLRTQREEDLKAIEQDCMRHAENHF